MTARPAITCRLPEIDDRKNQKETARMMNNPLSRNRLNDLAKFTNPANGLVPQNAPVAAAANLKSPADHGLKQLTLSEFLKPMLTAMKQQQPWVEDFGADQIMLPADLYEVVKAFSGMQKPQTSTAVSEKNNKQNKGP